MNRQQEDLHHIWHPYTPLLGMPDPILVESAKGIFLNTADGRKIIDGISSWWVNLHGHSHPLIAEAIHTQAKTLEHVIFAGFTHEPAIALAIKLKSILPLNQEKIFYSDNGSTAVEVAMKMALQYWRNCGLPRRKIVAMEGAYHGDTFGAMSVGDRGLFTKAFAEQLFDVEFIPFPDGTNDDEVVARFTMLIADGDAAAFIYEPLIQAAGGMRMYAATTLRRLLQVAQAAGTICIADEVFTGFGRTGTLFASQEVDLLPDIMTLSKGLTGGTMALGVTSCSKRIVEAFLSVDKEHTFYHGHSFTANPLACAAALASFDLLMREECRNQINLISAKQRLFAESIAHETAVSGVRTMGTILAFDVKTHEATSYTNEIRKRIYDFFIKRNILLRPLGNVVYFLPSYAFSDKNLNTVYGVIREFIRQLPSK